MAPLKILFLNSGYCTGLNGQKKQYLTKCFRYIYTGNKTFEKLVGLIQNIRPDVLALAEIDSGSIRNNHLNQIRKLAKECNFETVIYKNKYDPSGIIAKLPILKFQSNAILIRQKDINWHYHYFNHGIKRLVLEAEIEPHLSFFVVHLALLKSIRRKQLHELSQIIQNKKEVILAGDFNTFQGIKELETLMKRHNLKSANSHNHATFPSFKPKKQLDYFLLSKEIRIKKFEIVENDLSDHRPLLLECEI